MSNSLVTESKDWENFLAMVAKEIKEGVIWYGRLPYFEDKIHPTGLWLIMSENDLPDIWEYRRHGSNIVYRKEQDPNTDYNFNEGRKIKFTKSEKVLVARAYETSL